MKKHLLFMLLLLLTAAGAKAQPDWGYTPNAYEGEHVVYVNLVDNDGTAVQINSGDYLGAFIDGECRGLQKARETNTASATNAIWYFPLRVKGSENDNGKAITFRYFDSSTNMEYKPGSTSQLRYDDGATTGMLSDLHHLKFVRPYYYNVPDNKVTVVVGKEVNLEDYFELTPEGANFPINIEWDYANNAEFITMNGNSVKGLKAHEDTWLGFNLGDLKNIGQYTSFSIDVVDELRGFTLYDVSMGRNDIGKLSITPDPADATIDASKIEIVALAQTLPDSWTFAEINASNDSGLDYYITPRSVGKGDIVVRYDGKQMGTCSLNIGQSYRQKAGWEWISVFAENNMAIEKNFADALLEMRSEDKLLYNDPTYGYFGDLSTASIHECYKVKIKEDPGYVDFFTSGGEYDPYTTEGKELAPGWNWVGLPYQYSHNLDEVFVSDHLAEGDRIVSKDSGFAEYDGNKWNGTLSTVGAGAGYMYYNAGSESKTLLYNAESGKNQPVSANNAPARMPSVWHYNTAPYADNMSIVADLGPEYADTRYSVGAFVGDECRGEGRYADGKCFITVHANKGEQIGFRLYDSATGEMRHISGSMKFAKTAGTLKAPVMLSVGGVETGISATGFDASAIDVVDGHLSFGNIVVKNFCICNASGAVVKSNDADLSTLAKGVYVVKATTGSGNTLSKKIVK